MSDDTRPKPSTAPGSPLDETLLAQVHPLVKALAGKIFVSPKGEVAFQADAIAQVEKGLTALAHEREAFLSAFQQVQNIALALHNQYPESKGPERILNLLEKAAAVALPMLNQADQEATQAMVDAVGEKFRAYSSEVPGEPLEDTGARVDLRDMRPIKG